MLAPLLLCGPRDIYVMVNGVELGDLAMSWGFLGTKRSSEFRMVE